MGSDQGNNLMFDDLWWRAEQWLSFGLNKAIGIIAATITFVGCWIYAVTAWGWFLGLAFGWIPAAIISVMAGFLTAMVWPIVVVGSVVLVLFSHLSNPFPH